MHTKEFARTLRAFAGLADFEKSQELHRFAGYFEQGHKETIVKRLKRMSRPTGYPLRLKDSLEAIEHGFRSLGATKPANAFQTVLELFAGRPGATIDIFIAETSTLPQITNLNVKRSKSADTALAKTIAGQLAQPYLDAEAFECILASMRSPKVVGTPTLALIANCYLDNRRIYRDRESALEAIERHFRGKPSRAHQPCDVLA